MPIDEIDKVLENGETLQTLAENSASVSIEATVNGKHNWPVVDFQTLNFIFKLTAIQFENSFI